MNVRYTDRVKQWTEGYDSVQEAQKRLENILGSSAGLATAEWDRKEDQRGRTLISLHLKDHTGEVEGLFAPDELRSEPQTDFRLYRLWGDLLQIQTRKLILELAETEG